MHSSTQDASSTSKSMTAPNSSQQQQQQQQQQQMQLLFEENLSLRKQMELLNEELQIEKSKQNKFVHDMNHEFRTPLNVIFGATQLLRDSNNKEESYDYINMIQRSAELLKEYVEQILSFREFEKPSTPTNFNNTSLNSSMSSNASSTASTPLATTAIMNNFYQQHPPFIAVPSNGDIKFPTKSAGTTPMTMASSNTTTTTTTMITTNNNGEGIGNFEKTLSASSLSLSANVSPSSSASSSAFFPGGIAASFSSSSPKSPAAAASKFRKSKSTTIIENSFRFRDMLEDVANTTRSMINCRPLPPSAVTGNSSTRSSKLDIKVYTMIDPRIPDLVRSDEGKIRQCLLNLTENAVKHTPKKGDIEIEAMLRYSAQAADQSSSSSSSSAFNQFSQNAVANEIELIVRDSGIGIDSQEQIRRAFEPFVQLNNVPNQIFKMEGTGLGLPLTKRLVEALGGTINLESEGRNQGVTATIRLSYDPSNRRIGMYEPAAVISPLEDQQNSSSSAASTPMMVSAKKTTTFKKEEETYISKSSRSGSNSSDTSGSSESNEAAISNLGNPKWQRRSLSFQEDNTLLLNLKLWTQRRAKSVLIRRSSLLNIDRRRASTMSNFSETSNSSDWNGSMHQGGSGNNNNNNTSSPNSPTSPLMEDYISFNEQHQQQQQQQQSIVFTNKEPPAGILVTSSATSSSSSSISNNASIIARKRPSVLFQEPLIQPQPQSQQLVPVPSPASSTAASAGSQPTGASPLAMSSSSSAPSPNALLPSPAPHFSTFSPTQGFQFNWGGDDKARAPEDPQGKQYALLVQSNTIMRRLWAKWLEQQGYTVRCVDKTTMGKVTRRSSVSDENDLKLDIEDNLNPSYEFVLCDANDLHFLTDVVRKAMERTSSSAAIEIPSSVPGSLASSSSSSSTSSTSSSSSSASLANFSLQNNNNNNNNNTNAGGLVNVSNVSSKELADEFILIDNAEFDIEQLNKEMTKLVLVGDISLAQQSGLKIEDEAEEQKHSKKKQQQQQQKKEQQQQQQQHQQQQQQQTEKPHLSNELMENSAHGKAYLSISGNGTVTVNTQNGNTEAEIPSETTKKSSSSASDQTKELATTTSSKNNELVSGDSQKNLHKCELISVSAPLTRETLLDVLKYVHQR